MDTSNPFDITRSRQVAALLASALALALVAGLLQFFSDAPPRQYSSAVHLASYFSVAVGLGWTLFQLVLHRNSRQQRSCWTLAFGAVSVFAAVQARDWLVGIGILTDDWLVDLPFWLLGSAMVYTTLRGLQATRFELRLWWVGFVLQSVFLLCDLWEGKSLGAWSISARTLASMAEWSELLAIECYVVALILVARTGMSARLDGANTTRRSVDGLHGIDDKAVFAETCRREGLAVPQTLLEGVGGLDALKWHVARDQLDRDLICKPRSGTGALGCLVFRRIAPDLFIDPDGAQIDLDTVLAWIDAYSRTTPALVQPLLRPDPELAGLAGFGEKSLATARVFSCLDDEGQPVVTHAVLRLPAGPGLEWPRKGAIDIPLDLATGRLGAFQDSHGQVSKSRALEGIALNCWPGVRTLALAAHRAFPQLVVVGWEVALTDEGPVLLEGNIDPEIMFSQRVCGHAMDSNRFGPLLQQQIAAHARKQNGV